MVAKISPMEIKLSFLLVFILENFGYLCYSEVGACFSRQRLRSCVFKCFKHLVTLKIVIAKNVRLWRWFEKAAATCDGFDRHTNLKLAPFVQKSREISHNFFRTKQRDIFK